MTTPTRGELLRQVAVLESRLARNAWLKRQRRGLDPAQWMLLVVSVMLVAVSVALILEVT